MGFITQHMRMSHVYQPVMLRTLLEQGGAATTEQIARAILNEDQSQLEYYQQIANNMVGRVLRDHGLVTKEPRKPLYQLNGANELTEDQVTKLIAACDQKLADYIAVRSRRIWEHRRRGVRALSGTVRYEVLKRAKYRCELCGVSAEEKALEVDHIVPRNHGGTDDVSNLQALCYTCNASKRDRDDTDFREVRDSYQVRQDSCLFCGIPAERVVMENQLAYAIRDGFPVTEHHTLIIPRRHVATYFELGQAEVNAVNELLSRVKVQIERLDKTVSGFNIGMNNGEDAGQTIFHCHVHRDTTEAR
jgi:5-methylcytosine-specific restriction endonuclease McrA